MGVTPWRRKRTFNAAIKCVDEMRLDGAVCTTCYDEHGQIVKQACSMAKTP